MLCLCLSVAGCETAPLVTDQNPQADFSHYRTFTLLSPSAPDSAKYSARVLALAQAARAAAVSALVSKGYTEASSTEADFSVVLQGQSLPRSPAAQTAFGNSVRTGRGRVAVWEPVSQDSVPYDERTLRVEVTDHRTGEMIWSGWTRKISSVPSRPEDVQKAVSRILARFPSNPALSSHAP